MATRKLNGNNDHAMDVLEASLRGHLMATLEHLQKVLMGLEQRIHDIEQELSRRNGL